MLFPQSILLTRSDVEPKVLIQALQRLENIINDNPDLDTQKLDHLLYLVEKLRTRKHATDKESKILHRDVIIFIGKYGNNNYINNYENDNIIAQLKDKLSLNIPNPDEGTSYKMNLQKILQLAIIHENPEALQRLLSIMCANLSASKDPTLQLSLTLVIRALCRAHSHTSNVDAASVQQAVLLCDSVPCLTALLRYISEEKSPGVRRMLSDALEGLLLSNAGSEAAEQLGRVAAERARVMVASEQGW
ncbi:uncharacterized protein LOC114358587 [Ostrinia furnacalis]|uniref:uncharacterized protein LOC114358587 n=1 Tax=Ostrinia furnacalis TaxID=93504 RepID=UPI00103A3ECD|nr:uncharacterized protein LOC114358587 [Ostrinia furnacalis]